MTVVAGFETCGWGASRMVNRRERDLGARRGVSGHGG
jgi:hypothetical protein